MDGLFVFQNGKLISEQKLATDRTYVVGRSSECDIVLSEVESLSRKHFRLSFSNNAWQVEVLSKFGQLMFLGEIKENFTLAIGATFSLGPVEFRLQPIHESIAAPESTGHELAAPLSAEPMSMPPMIMPENGEALARLDKTTVGQNSATPYLRITSPQLEKDEVLRLEGHIWSAGREKSCEIHLPDKGASRRQFEISRANDGFYITDLNSSNGTLLNGNRLPPDQPQPLQSGDVLTVLSLNLYFEVRDAQFEKKLALVPQQLLDLQPALEDYGPAASAMAPHPHAYLDNAAGHTPDGLNYPAHYTPGQYTDYPQDQAVRYLPAGGASGAPDQAAQRAKRKKIITLTGAALAALVVIKMSLAPSPQDKKKSDLNRGPANIHEGFTQLSADEQTMIRDTYALAQNLHLQQKCELALAEIQRVHALVPFYEDSKKIETECQQAKEIRLEREYIAQQKRAADELQQKVVVLLSECEEKVAQFQTMEQLNRCLAPVLELNPEAVGLQTLRDVVTKREDEARMKSVAQESYREKIKQMQGLYERAHQLEKSGQDYNAVQAYEKVINTRLPDPSDLKQRSERSIASLRGVMGSKTDSILANAKAQFDQNQYRQSLQTLQEGLKIDPHHTAIKSQIENYKGQVTKKMKVIYQDSILEESMGNIESAKDKWKKILEQSYPENDYYQKAQSKLKLYEGA